LTGIKEVLAKGRKTGIGMKNAAYSVNAALPYSKRVFGMLEWRPDILQSPDF
jgi:hypothetical protein